VSRNTGRGRQSSHTDTLTRAYSSLVCFTGAHFIDPPPQFTPPTTIPPTLLSPFPQIIVVIYEGGMRLCVRLCASLLGALVASSLISARPINSPSPLPSPTEHTTADAKFRHCCVSEKVPSTLLDRCNYTAIGAGFENLPAESEPGFEEYIVCLGVGRDINDCCSK
jgi:hypothetical protein